MSYRFDDFQACLNQVFVLSMGDYRDDLELVEVQREDLPGDDKNRTAFTVVFRSNKMEAIAQQTYPLLNEQMGELQLFIVPIGQDENGTRYEAVFS